MDKPGGQICLFWKSKQIMKPADQFDETHSVYESQQSFSTKITS